MFLKDFIKRIFCMVWCTCRLVLLLLITFLSGLHHIVFNKLEIINIQLAMRPQQPELDKISYIDKLYSQNVALGRGIKEPAPDAFDFDNFKTDEELDEIDDSEWEDDMGGDQGEEGDSPDEGSNDGN